MNDPDVNDKTHLLEETYSATLANSNTNIGSSANASGAASHVSQAEEISIRKNESGIETQLPSRMKKFDRSFRADGTKLRNLPSLSLPVDDGDDHGDHEFGSIKRSGSRLLEHKKSGKMKYIRSDHLLYQGAKGDEENMNNDGEDSITMAELKCSCLYLNTKIEMCRKGKIITNKSLSSYLPMDYLKNLRSESHSTLKRFLSSVFESQVSRIEAKYGYGQALYFDFLRFLFFINMVMTIFVFFLLIIPGILERTGTIATTAPNKMYFEMMKKSRLPLELLITSDSISRDCKPKTNETLPHNTFVDACLNIMFSHPPYDRYFMLYGSFSSTVLPTAFGGYHFAFAYMYTWVVCNMVSLVLIIVFYETGKQHTGKISTRTLTMWKFSVVKKGHVERKQMENARILKSGIEEKQREAMKFHTNYDDRIYVKRVIIWNVVICIYISCCLMIYFVNYATKGLINSSSTNAIYKLMRSRASVLTASALTVIFRSVIGFLTNLEKYSPTVSVTVYIIRVFILNVLQVGTIFVNIYKATPECSLCWENEIASEMWLTLHILLMQCTAKAIFYIIYGRFKQTTGDFGLPDSLLDLVVSQMVVWLGMFFMPLISVVALLYFAILFYVQQAALYSHVKFCFIKYNSDKLYRNVMMSLQFSYIVAMLFASYGLVRMRASCCGPFGPEFCNKGLAPFTITNAAFANLPEIILIMARILQSPLFVYVSLATICFFCFYYRSNFKIAVTERKSLTERLSMAHIDKSFLLSEVKKLQEMVNKIKDESLSQFVANKVRNQNCFQTFTKEARSSWSGVKMMETDRR